MVPIWMRLRVGKAGRRAFRLSFPVILVWILLFAMVLAVFPFLLIAALVTSRRGPGFMLLAVYPALAVVLWNLSGLYLEIRNDENEILIDFI